MLYFYTAGVAAVVMAFVIVVTGLKGRPIRVKGPLVWSLSSIFLVTVFNIVWSGFVANFYWGHSDAPSQNYLNLAARLICQSDTNPNQKCLIEKNINTYTLTVPEEAKLSDHEIKMVRGRADDVGVLLYLIEPNYGKYIYIDD